MSRTHLAAISLFFLAPPMLATASCALGGEEEPGCHADTECTEGFVCRGGACFRITTSLSPPNDPGKEDDAGDSGPPDQG